MMPARTMRVPISFPSAMRWRRASRESVSLARSRTVVTPAARLRRPSLSPTWACMSQRPGRRVLPVASMIWGGGPAPTLNGTSSDAENAIALMTTFWSGMILPVSASNTLAWVNMIRVGDG